MRNPVTLRATRLHAQHRATLKVTRLHFQTTGYTQSDEASLPDIGLHSE